jgi:CheY-specific phosphatase CheX
VVAGQAKTMLNVTPFHFSLSTPIVTRVSENSSRKESSSDRVAVLLGFEEGQLRLEISLTAEPGR